MRFGSGIRFNLPSQPADSNTRSLSKIALHAEPEIGDTLLREGGSG